MNLKQTIDCPVRQAIYRLTNTGETAKKPLLFMNAGKECLAAYLSGNRGAFEQYFRSAYAEIDCPYEWSFETMVSEDAKKWERLVSFIFDEPVYSEDNCRVPVGYQRNENVKLVDSYRTIETVLGYVEIPIIVSITMKEDVSYHAYYLRNHKNSGYISNSARKSDNLPQNNVILASIKHTLNHDYPGIIVHCVGMSSNKDTTAVMMERLSSVDDAYHSFEEWYQPEDREEAFKDFIGGLLSHMLDSVKCTDCSFENEFCHMAKFIPEQEHLTSPGNNQFTENQLDAIHSVDGPLLVTACPGSGKTTVMVERVKYMIGNLGIAPERILVITFSKSAAENLERRIPATGDGAKPYISTIHSLCLDIMRQVNEDICIEETDVRYHILNMLIDQRKIKGAVSSGLYDQRTGFIVRLDKVIQSMRDKNKEVSYGSFDEKEIQELYHSYEEIRRQMNCVSYDELLEMTATLLKTNRGICRLLQNRYRYVMVDEYQDVDSVQDEIVRLIAGERGNVMVVGDADQSIYGFRGGSNIHMLKFREHYPNAKQVSLSDNFRSTNNITTCAERLIKHNRERFDVSMHAHKSGRPVELYNSIVWERDLVILIRNFIQEGYGYGDIAIITRNNAELKKINAILGSDVSRLNKTYLYNDPIFLTALSVLQLWQDRHDAEAFLRLVAIHTDIDIAQIEGCGIYPFLGNGSFSDVFRDLWRKVDSVLEIVEEDTGAGEFFKHLLYTFFGIYEHPVVTELLSCMKELKRAGLTGAYRTVKNMHDINADKRVVYPLDNRITLLTAHDSKGLEFPCVIVCGLEDFDYDGEESRRLLYVALTRAKERLVITQTKDTENSPYWEELMEKR